jgi:hypothetical protein
VTPPVLWTSKYVRAHVPDQSQRDPGPVIYEEQSDRGELLGAVLLVAVLLSLLGGAMWTGKDEVAPMVGAGADASAR